MAAVVVMALTVPSAAGAASVEHLSTGVGVNERVAHRDYPVLLTFAEARGAYLASIAVEIKDAGGKVVLATTSAGPWLFAKLPAGSYKVVATRVSGERTGADFDVGTSGQVVVRLTW
jgi:hypothetical protein